MRFRPDDYASFDNLGEVIVVLVVRGEPAGQQCTEPIAVVAIMA